MKSLQNRSIIAALLLLMVLVFDYLGSFFWAGFILAFSLLGVKEFWRLCEAREIKPSRFWIQVCIVVFIIFPVFVDSEYMFICQGFLIALSFTIILLRMFLRSHGTEFADVAASIWSIIYLGFLPSFFVWTRGLESGFEFIIILIATVSISDIAALFIGKAIGKIPLSPQISPNKTVEGAIGGLLCATAAFFGMVKYFEFSVNFFPINLFFDFISDFGATVPETQNLTQLSLFGFSFENMMIILFGFILAFISQVGDLVESLFKREAGVKDSGTILQAHGGILDRVDSHYFAAWLAYFIFYYLIK